MHRCLLFSKSARLLILPLMLESNKSARTEPRPTVKRRTVRKSSLIDGGRGETISFGWNDCRRLARRRYCLGPSIRCGAVVPARQLSKYYILRAGHLVQDEKNSSTEPRAEPLPTRHLCLTSWICPSNSSLSRGWYSMGFCLKIWWIWRRMLTEWKIFCSTQY